MYDFHKVRNDSTDSEYKNALFQRGEQKMLSEIKRKNGDNNLNDEFSNQPGEANDSSDQMVQNASGNNINIDDGSKADNNQIFVEVSNLKQKQTNLEQAMTMLISQHETLIRENKIFWDEIRRQSEQDDLRSEKIMMLLAFFLNRNNQNNNQNNQRSLALSQLNNRRNTFQTNIDDIQQFINGQNYQKRDKQDDYSFLLKEMQSLNNGQYPYEKDYRNQTVYSLPISKKYKNELNPQISNQVKKLLEQYSNSDSDSQDMIASYIQYMINQGTKQENRTKYITNGSESTIIAPMNHDKPPLPTFERNPKKIFIQQEPQTAAFNDNSDTFSPFDRKTGTQNKISNVQPQFPSTISIDNDGGNIFNKPLYQQSPNNTDGGNDGGNLFGLSRTNSQIGHFENPAIYSPIPSRIYNDMGEISNPFPSQYNNYGPQTPVPNYDGEEEEDIDYTQRSRRASFDKNNQSPNINY